MPKFVPTILLGLLLAACRPATPANLNVAPPPLEPAVQATSTTAALLVRAEVSKLVAQIDDWGLYGKVSDGSLDGSREIFVFDVCDDLEMDAFTNQLNAGEIYHLSLNEGFDLYYTPNYKHWDIRQYQSFLGQRNYCGVVPFYLLKAYADKLLWGSICSAGAIPDESSLAYERFKKCSEAEQAVDIFRERME